MEDWQLDREAVLSVPRCDREMKAEISSIDSNGKVRLIHDDQRHRTGDLEPCGCGAHGGGFEDL